MFPLLTSSFLIQVQSWLSFISDEISHLRIDSWSSYYSSIEGEWGKAGTFDVFSI